jgi:acid phosphatase
MKYRTDTVHGHDFGIAMLTKFRNTYLGPISDRLSDMTSNFHFSNGEVYSMQEMCGFETLARGYSPWCNVFTRDDWVNFEYARDIIHFYRAGPGNPYGPAMGWLWINATLNLLLQGQAAGPFFFSLYDLIHPSSPLFALGKLTLSVYMTVTLFQCFLPWKSSPTEPLFRLHMFYNLDRGGPQVSLRWAVAQLSNSCRVPKPPTLDETPQNTFASISTMALFLLRAVMMAQVEVAP